MFNFYDRKIIDFPPETLANRHYKLKVTSNDLVDTEATKENVGKSIIKKLCQRHYLSSPTGKHRNMNLMMRQLNI